MVKGLGGCIVKEMSAFRTKKVKVYIGVSSELPDTGSNFERMTRDGVYDDPDEVAGKLMDLSFAHYVWDWKVFEMKIRDDEWLVVDLVCVPSTNYKTNIDADLIEGIITRMRK